MQDAITFEDPGNGTSIDFINDIINTFNEILDNAYAENLNEDILDQLCLHRQELENFEEFLKMNQTEGG